MSEYLSLPRLRKDRQCQNWFTYVSFFFIITFFCLNKRLCDLSTFKLMGLEGYKLCLGSYPKKLFMWGERTANAAGALLPLLLQLRILQNSQRVSKTTEWFVCWVSLGLSVYYLPAGTYLAFDPSPKWTKGLRP